jgi:hypothetical protein
MDNAGLDDGFLDPRRQLKKALHLLHRAELHDPLDAGAVVPAAIEDHDFARGGQVSHIALNIHLRLLALGRRGQRDDAIDARADPLRDRLDDAALAGAVSAFEHDNDFQSLGDDPELQLDQFAVQLGELALVVLAAELLLIFQGALVPGFFGLIQTLCRSHPSLPFRSLHHGCACLVKQQRAWTKSGGSKASRRRRVANRANRLLCSRPPGPRAKRQLRAT